MMHNFRKVRTKTLLAKALVYRILAFLGQGTILFLLTGSLAKALGFSVVLEAFKMLCYFAYDLVFARLYKVTEEQGCVLWFTGLPCSGKSTLADAVNEELKHRGVRVERLDGDIVRKSLTSDLGFSKEDRAENLKRVTFVSKLLSRNGAAVLCSFVSPYREARDRIRQDTTNFIEIFVKCSVEECERRDVKGMYKLAREGKIKDFTGIDDPYEDPVDPELIVDTETETLEESVHKVLEYLTERGFL